MRILWLTCSLLLVASTAWSQQVPDSFLLEPESMGEGWKGFTDLAFMADALAKLVLAAVLGALIAYHPRLVETADTLVEIEAPKVTITYSVIGALIGIMVVKYGLVVGFVLFGIGGLMRFRTLLRSPSLTGYVILATLIGLSCGLDLPHVAVLATVFAFVLIQVLNSRITYRIRVRALPAERVAESAAAYRRVLEEQGCLVKNEKKNPKKKEVTFIFRGAKSVTQQALEVSLETAVDESLKGSLDWEVD
jgi:hypothetical protein